MTEARRYNPEAAREDILNAAERLFVERGFGEVSTTAIAKEAGVAQSQIHYHFQNKHKLWMAVLMRGFAAYHMAQAALLQDDQTRGLERMERSIDNYFRFFQSKPQFARLMMRAFLDPNLMQHGEEKHELFILGAKAIAEGQRDGLLRKDVRPEFILFGFLSMVAHYFQVRDFYLPSMGLEGAPQDYDEEYLQAIKAIFLTGIAP